MNNSYITIIKEKRTALSRKRIPLNQNGCTANFRIGVPFGQNLQNKTEKLLGIHGISTAMKKNWLAGGFKWERADRKEIFYDKNVSNKKIICITNGKVFNSGIIAAKWCGIKNYKNIYVCCRNKKRTS